MKRLFLALAVLAFAGGARAQDNSAKQIAAIPTLVAQRNNAMDALAICSGETATLQAKIVELQKQLDELEPKEEPKK